MSPLIFYKRLENVAVGYLRTQMASFVAFVRRLFRQALQTGEQRITVMVIPHSQETKIVRFRVSVFSLIFVGLLLSAVLAVVVVSRVEGGTLAGRVAHSSTQLALSQTKLEQVHDRISTLEEVAAAFNEKLEETLAELQINRGGTPSPLSRKFGILAASLAHDPNMAQQDSQQLHELDTMLSASVASLNEIAALYKTHTQVLHELPTLWPVQGGAGIITTYFGPAIEPFTGAMYLHLGIDIADGVGTPLVAAGDGTVVDIEYQPLGYGKYVLIRHCCGYATRYAHMSQIWVRIGEKVKQGQVIGLMGDTGLSTGPHVHFEIHLGGQVIDPMLFMDIGRRDLPPVFQRDASLD